MSHMEAASFHLEISDDKKVAVFKVTGIPEVCCHRCLGKFILGFVQQTIDLQEEADENIH